MGGRTAGDCDRTLQYQLIPKTKASALVLDWQPMLEALLADIRAGAAPGAMAAQFHDGLALAIAAMPPESARRRSSSPAAASRTRG